MRRGAIACDTTRAPDPRLTRADIAELERLIARTEAKFAALSASSE